MSRHILPHFHWCGDCWKWVCDCEHCVEPLSVPRSPVKDLQIRSLGYELARGRLEIEFTARADVRQFYPIPPAVFRELLAAKPMYSYLDRIFKRKGLRWQHVRTEEKRAVMMAGIASKFLRLPGLETTES